MSSYNKLTSIFLQKFTDIILLAGHSSVRMCDNYPHAVFNNNVRNFVNLIHKLNSNQTLIYASSASVYGNCLEQNVDENYTLGHPYNMYDLTKQMIDHYYLTCKPASRIFGLRFGTVNGYSPILRTDVMLNAMTTTAWEKDKILLFNENTKRSILGTNDMVAAIRTLIFSNKSDGGIYNIASFTKTSGQMAEIVSKKINCPIEKILPNTQSDFKLNEKLISNKYDFSLSCDKFVKDFNFTFNESIDTILDGLIQNKHKMIFTDRNKSYNYD
jgi:nucleoside-diphosphate-sugar epimerase